jgi:hypothetical protein
MVACVVPQVPEASFFDEMKLSALRTVSDARPHFRSACVARPVVSMAALEPLEYTPVSSAVQEACSPFSVRASRNACTNRRVKSRSRP